MLRRNEKLAPGPGRPRTTGCTEPHYGPCKRCAAARARRFRAKSRPETRYASSSPAATRLLLHQRSELSAARRYVLTYLVRGAIVPPYACDRCGIHYGDPRRRGIVDEPRGSLVPLHEIPRATTLAIERRRVAWLCPPCRKEIRAIGAVVDCHWQWPGPTLPRRHRGVVALDARAHAAAVDAARLATDLQRARIYCEAYLEKCAAPDAWLARIIREPNFSPAREASFDQAWRNYAAAWWDRRRRAAHADEPVAFVHLRALRERPLRHAPTVETWSGGVTRRERRVVELYDEAAQLRMLEQAEAAFDLRIAEILNRGDATRARAYESDDPDQDAPPWRRGEVE